MKPIISTLSLFVLFFTISCARKAPDAPVKQAHVTTDFKVAQNQPAPAPIKPPLPSIQNSQPPEPANKSSEVAFPAGDPNGSYATRIIPAEGGTFGYEILKEGRPMIRQTTIPGMPGNAGFANEADARKVADAVLIKMKKGEMPPTVSEEELKEMNVLK